MQEDDELRDATLVFYEAVGAGDEDAFRTVASDEPGFLVIGTAPEEWWDNRDAFVQAASDSMSRNTSVGVSNRQVLGQELHG